jgi:hypothetical protein
LRNWEQWLSSCAVRLKKACVILSSHTLLFDLKKLLDKMEVVLNVCYHEKTSEDFKNKIRILYDLWLVIKFCVKHFSLSTISEPLCILIQMLG